MGFYYLDASALVKRYVTEPGSTWVRELLDRISPDGKRVNTVFIAEISIVEVAAALAILARTGHIRLRDRDLAYRRFLKDTVHLYQLVPVRTSDLHAAARLTQRHPLKAYDAIQLAVALREHHALVRRKLGLAFVSGDRQQLRAAEAEGLTTDDPFDHLAPSDSPTPGELRSDER